MFIDVYRYVYCRSFEAPAVKLPFDVPTCQDHHFEIPHPSEHVKKNNTFPGASPKNETVFISDLKKLTRFKIFRSTEWLGGANPGLAGNMMTTPEVGNWMVGKWMVGLG